MPWITKNSGTMDVPRQDKPYLTEELKAKLEADVLPRYPTKQAATLPALHAVQHEVGWLPYQAIEEIAAFLELTPAEVLDTATFYEEFFLKPKGKHLIWVCQSLSCELLGNKELVSACRNKLGIEPGQTTDDGRFTLMDVECLGSCGTAPCALLNETLHEDLTVEGLEKAIDELE